MVCNQLHDTTDDSVLRRGDLYFEKNKDTNAQCLSAHSVAVSVNRFGCHKPVIHFRCYSAHSNGPYSTVMLF